MNKIIVSEFGLPSVMHPACSGDLLSADGQLLVRIRAAGVNPVDAYIRSGTYARRPELPYTPGSDGAGTVVGAGRGVTGFQPGDRVYLSGSLSGTYAELALCLPEQAHLLPERVSFAQGAAMGVPYATAFRALFQKARATGGEWVLVHGGSGGVGVAAVQLAKAAGCRVIATAGTPQGRALVEKQGAEAALDHGASGYLDRVAEITGGTGVNVIIEMLANVNLAHDLEILAPQGRVVVVGSRGTVTIDPRSLMTRDATVCGMVLFNAAAAEHAAIHAALVKGLTDGSLNPVADRVFPLAQAAAAHEAVMAPGALGKIVLEP